MDVSQSVVNIEKRLYDTFLLLNFETSRSLFKLNVFPNELCKTAHARVSDSNKQPRIC